MSSPDRPCAQSFGTMRRLRQMRFPLGIDQDSAKNCDSRVNIYPSRCHTAFGLLLLGKTLLGLLKRFRDRVRPRELHPTTKSCNSSRSAAHARISDQAARWNKGFKVVDRLIDSLFPGRSRTLQDQNQSGQGLQGSLCALWQVLRHGSMDAHRSQSTEPVTVPDAASREVQHEEGSADRLRVSPGSGRQGDPAHLQTSGDHLADQAQRPG